MTRNGHRPAVRSPIGRADVLIHTSWLSAGERDDGESPERLESVDRRLPGRERERPVARERQQVGCCQIEGPRLAAAKTRRVDPVRLAIPRRAVDDGVSVCGEARLADMTMAERELMNGDRRRRR